MTVDVITAFRRRLLSDELPRVRAESDNVRVVADPTSGDPPRRLHGLFLGVEWFTRAPDGAYLAIQLPLSFTLDVPDDYCSCADGSLQLRVARVTAPLVHPNVGPGGTVCLGPRFRPATRLRPLLEHLHRICTGRVFASESPFDPNAAEFFRQHNDRIRELRSAPLWRRPVARQVVVTSAVPEGGGSR